MRHLLLRVLDALLLIWIVTTLTFVLIHLAPGDPASLLASPTATASEIARLQSDFGLNESLPVQYARWMTSALSGNLGNSLAQSRSVVAVIIEAAPVSLYLGGISLLGSFVIGTLVGGVQARHSGQRADSAITVVSITLYAAPSFWLALAAVALATTGASALGAPAWARLPAFGMHEPAALATGFDAWRDLARHSILPLLVLTIPGAAGVARYARASLIESARHPYVQAAYARGLSERRVNVRYVLRNALTPLVVLLGLTLPGLIAGSVFIEQIFAWPGLGRLMLSSIASRDYPVVLGLTLVYSSVVIAANLLADIVVAKLDPRRGG